MVPYYTAHKLLNWHLQVVIWAAFMHWKHHRHTWKLSFRKPFDWGHARVCSAAVCWQPFKSDRGNEICVWVCVCVCRRVDRYEWCSSGGPLSVASPSFWGSCGSCVQWSLFRQDIREFNQLQDCFTLGPNNVHSTVAFYVLIHEIKKWLQ